ncbi:MAG TPA: penicillin-binding transpeptidase domain-containing protein [Oligoflexus sp.]|uniref:penicillin-binding transpeptidase domain-containing protein n=1 Tax=Oligoflexus sp. TaxID=1971216 RepID=UPI002D5EC97F|nr:penicillin-binding transpeptidase domain-containing protein [Oligoflexus sp.]HYX35295.1 penicillin-binding transpeptidase domain-containing protein [Oligoflexus sp.]
MSNSHTTCRGRLYFSLLWLAGCLACQQSSAQKGDDTTTPPAVAEASKPQSLTTLPVELPEWSDTEAAPLLAGRPVTIVPQIQNQISRFIRNGGSPIAALVMVNVKTGEILAMAQGAQPGKWGSETHSALHIGFPTASLFKTVVAATAFEIADLDTDETLSMFGGCSHVHPRGIWPNVESRNPNQGLSLRRAYGNSCNGFFAKLAVNRIGLGPILNMARKLGWNQSLAADFMVPPSPLREPKATSSSIHTIGKFAAGFGAVSISAVHAAWQEAVIANNGMSMPMRLFKDTAPSNANQGIRILEETTAINLKRIMDSTVMDGTAKHAFSRGRLRLLRTEVGGKTGTLTGNHPQGLTTWFAGIYPLEDPEIAVAAVVMLENLWKFKATNLAAESIMAYYDYRNGPDSPMKTARKSASHERAR